MRFNSALADPLARYSLMAAFLPARYSDASGCCAVLSILLAICLSSRQQSKELFESHSSPGLLVSWAQGTVETPSTRRYVNFPLDTVLKRETCVSLSSIDARFTDIYPALYSIIPRRLLACFYRPRKVSRERRVITSIRTIAPIKINLNTNESLETSIAVELPTSIALTQSTYFARLSEDCKERIQNTKIPASG